MIVMDTDVLVDFERRSPNCYDWIAGLAEPPTACGFAAFELYNGVENRSDRIKVRRVLERFQLAWPTPLDLERALEFFAKFRLSHNLSMCDAIIASTALGCRADLATFNGRHFSTIKGLTIVEPYSR